MHRETLLDFFDDRIRSDRPFLVYDGGYRTYTWSYAEIGRAARRFAASLRQHGLAPGDRVVLWGENRAEWIVAFWGCLAARTVAVPIDLRASPDLVGRVVRIVAARLVVAGEGLRPPPLPGVETWALDELLGGGAAHDPPAPEPAPALFDDAADGDDAGRVSGWTALPPSLVRRAFSDTSAFLVGARRPSLLALLREAADILEADVTCTPQAAAPQLVTVDVRDPEDLDLIATEVGITLLPAPSATLLGACPPLSQIARAVPITAPPGGAHVSRYDAASGKWDPATGISGDGSYRVDTRPVRYVVSHHRSWFEVDNLVAKYASAALGDIASLAYDSGTRMLCVPLGARLPDLFERAVVLCSGKAPATTRDGRIAYFDVPAEVAVALWSKLGPGKWQEE